MQQPKLVNVLPSAFQPSYADAQSLQAEDRQKARLASVEHQQDSQDHFLQTLRVQYAEQKSTASSQPAGQQKPQTKASDKPNADRADTPRRARHTDKQSPDDTRADIRASKSKSQDAPARQRRASDPSDAQQQEPPSGPSAPPADASAALNFAPGLSSAADTGASAQSDASSANRNAASANADGTEAIDAAVPAPEPILGDLALALRIQSGGSSNTSSEQPAKNPLFQNAGIFSAGASAESPTPSRDKVDSQVQGMLAPAAIADSAHSANNAAANPTQASGSTTSSDFEAELSKFRTAEPVRGAHVQISGADAQRVDIRLVERAGGLAVTVRSADDSLSRALQDHAPELNSRLNLEHFRTEMWTPTSNRNSFDRNGQDSQNAQSNGSGGNPNERQNRKQQPQPDWVDEVEKNPSAFQNRIDYTWQP